MNLTVEQKVDNILVWTDALESGEYKQLKEFELGDVDSGFCCIGLGCYVLDIDFLPHHDASDEFQHCVGLLDPLGCFVEAKSFYAANSLAEANDDTNAGFKRIAKLIKNHPDWMFEPEVAEALTARLAKKVH